MKEITSVSYEEFSEYRKRLKKRRNYTFGCDPEFFVRDKKGRNRVPEFLIGEIDKYRGWEITKDVTMFLDGPAIEFSCRPSNRPKVLFNRIQKALNEVRKLLKSKGYYISPFASATFEKEYMKDIPKEIWEIGCSPDVILYRRKDGKERLVTVLDDNPPKIKLTNKRFAGGHIHIGFVEDEEDNKNSLSHIVVCSEITTRFYYSFARSHHDFNVLDVIKKTISRLKSPYGNPFRCRIKSYGIELRAFSNTIFMDEGLFYSQVESFVYNFGDFRSTVDEDIENFQKRILELYRTSLEIRKEFSNLEEV